MRLISKVKKLYYIYMPKALKEPKEVKPKEPKEPRKKKERTQGGCIIKYHLDYPEEERAKLFIVSFDGFE